MIRFLTLALLMAGTVFAADIDGKWTGSVEGPGGPMPIAYTFKADGAALNGTMTGPDGGDLKLTDGKIDGNNISFTVTIDFGGQAITLMGKGVLAGADLKIALDFMGMPFEFTLKKELKA